MRNLEKLARHILDNGGATVTESMLEPHPLERYRVSARKDLEHRVYVPDYDGNIAWRTIGHEITHYLWRLPADALDPGNYLGAWLDDGMLYIDIVRAYVSRDTAKIVGKRAKQLAIYDAVTDTTFTP